MPHTPRESRAVYARVEEYPVTRDQSTDGRPKSKKKLKRLRKIQEMNLKETNARILTLLKVGYITFCIFVCIPCIRTATFS